MSFSKEDCLNIGETVMEQLGIEEEEDVPEVVLSEDILILKEEIEKKDVYIQELEDTLCDLTKRMENLEKIVYLYNKR